MEDFEKIYNELNENNSELYISWKEIKEEEKKINKIANIIWPVMSILFIIAFWERFKASNLLILIILYIIVVTKGMLLMITTMILFSGKKYKKFKKEYKNIVIKRMISNFYNNSYYLPNQPMQEEIYNQVGYENYNSYKSDDYIKAQIDNKYNFQMAEILTEEEKEYIDSRGRKYYKRIKKFHGLFAKIEMDKTINSELKIVENSKMFLNKNRLKMDSSEFEKYFDVQASNKIIGMQILTADIMEELVKFERETKIKYDIYIKNNEIYLRFHTGEMFESISIKKEMINKENTYKYFNTLKFTYNVTKKIIDVINNVQI